MHTLKYTLSALVWFGSVGGWATASYAEQAEAAAAPAPASAPGSLTAADLIDQLGDPDPAVREAASRALAEMGKDALPALQEARDADAPEVRARVRSLIRKAERRLPPAAPPRHGLGSRQSVRVSMVNGQKSVDVDDNGYRIKIRQGPEGIVMDVTGVEEGLEVTETYKAKDAEELKKENPEAFALYDKYNNGGGAGAFHIQMGGGNGQVHGQVIVGGADMELRMMEAQIRAMEGLLLQLEDNPNLPPEHRARIQEQVERLRDRQADMQQKQLENIEQRRKNALDKMKVPLREEPAAEEKKADQQKAAPEEPEAKKPEPEKPEEK